MSEPVRSRRRRLAAARRRRSPASSCSRSPHGAQRSAEAAVRSGGARARLASRDARFSSEDPAKSPLESKRTLHAEGVVFLSAPSNFLVQRFQNLDSKDLGLKGLSMKHDRSSRGEGPRVEKCGGLSLHQGGISPLGRMSRLRSNSEISPLSYYANWA